jgi:short-subunit dehydrogenase
MAARERGGIVLVSSLSATHGSPLIANYAATKTYNLVLAEGRWGELRARLYLIALLDLDKRFRA